MHNGKALFITPVLPDAGGGGLAKRAHQWLEQLSRSWDVHVLAIPAQDRRARAIPIESRAQPGERVLYYGKPAGRLPSDLLGWRSASKDDAAFLAATYSGMRFAKIVCFRSYLVDIALCAQRLTQCPSLEVDMDDVESDARRSIARLAWLRGRWKKALLMTASSAFFRLKERQLGRRIAQLYVCSEEDAALLMRRSSAWQVKVLPNRLSIRTAPHPLPLPPAQQRRSLLFVGTLDYYPNEEAVRWVVKHLLPRLRSGGRERWTFHVAGFGGSPALLRQLREADGVIFHGSVEQVRPLYAAAAIAVAPLRAGGGTKLKVLEAMGFGRPVIASKEGVRGLKLENGTHYFHAETAEQYAQACERLAEEDAVYAALVHAARALLEAHYVYGTRQPAADCKAT